MGEWGGEYDDRPDEYYDHPEPPAARSAEVSADDLELLGLSWRASDYVGVHDVVDAETVVPYWPYAVDNPVPESEFTTRQELTEPAGSGEIPITRPQETPGHEDGYRENPYLIQLDFNEFSRTSGTQSRAQAVKRFPQLLRQIVKKAGQYSQPALVASLAAAALAPLVVAAIQSFGAFAPMLLNHMGSFGLGYLTNRLTEWSKQQKGKANLQDEDQVARILADLWPEATLDGQSQAQRDLAVILADPVVIQAVMDTAMTSGPKLKDLLLKTAPAELAAPLTVADDWLLDEVLDVLEHLARQPSKLEAALTGLYVHLAVDEAA